MKAVLLSIRPEWCKKILSGEKTVELRRTCPVHGTPFKVYMPNDQRARVLVRGMSDERPEKFAGNGKKPVRRGGS